MSLESPDEIIRAFHKLYYSRGWTERGTWMTTTWMGVPMAKCPMDLLVCQDLVRRIRPQLIVETGTAYGGSALFLAHLCDLLGAGEVTSIDVRLSDTRPQHPRITYIQGSSIDPGIVAEVRRRAQGKSPVMILLDSDHRRDHVLAKLRAYHSIVSPGSYLIVEDTNVNGRPVLEDFGPGPHEAIEQFMRENSDFEIDPLCEPHLMTFNPGGFLRKRTANDR